MSSTSTRPIAIAADAAPRFGLGDECVRLLGLIERDQWTVAGYDQHRPLYLFAADDGRGTEFYISSTTGAVVQMTTTIERIGNWLGIRRALVLPDCASAERLHSGARRSFG